MSSLTYASFIMMLIGVICILSGAIPPDGGASVSLDSVVTALFAIVMALFGFMLRAMWGEIIELRRWRHKIGEAPGQGAVSVLTELHKSTRDNVDGLHERVATVEERLHTIDRRRFREEESDDGEFRA